MHFIPENPLPPMPTHPHVSLKDIARELNVSVSTVSRALNDSPEISKELKETVCELARQRGYRPNPFARSLRKGYDLVVERGRINPD